MFFQKPAQVLESKEYRTLNSDILSLEKKVIVLETRLDQLALKFASLQGKVYQVKAEEEEEQPKEKKTESLKTFNPFA